MFTIYVDGIDMAEHLADSIETEEAVYTSANGVEFIGKCDNSTASLDLSILELGARAANFASDDDLTGSVNRYWKTHPRPRVQRSTDIPWSTPEFRKAP